MSKEKTVKPKPEVENQKVDDQKKPGSKFKEGFLNFVKKYPVFIGMIVAIIYLIILIAIATKGFSLDHTKYCSVAFSIGKLDVAWYAIFILSGIIVAAFWGMYEFPRIGVKRNDLYDGLLAIIPLSIIGARLYYVIFDNQGVYNSFVDVINIRDGGLAIHGAVLTALISAIVFAKIKKINVLKIFDVVVIGFLIGQIFGRWGNFMNREAFGSAVTPNWFFNLTPKFIRNNMVIDVPKAGMVNQPTFLYESFLNFLLLSILLVIRRCDCKVFKVRVGDIFAIYLIGYGLIRGGFIEWLRTDPLHIGGARINIILPLVLAGLAVIFMIVKNRVPKFREMAPYYMDVVEEMNLYEKGLEGKEARKARKVEEKRQKAKRRNDRKERRKKNKKDKKK